MKKAICTLKSVSPYSQSRYLQEKRTKDETPAAFEERSWHLRCHFFHEEIMFEKSADTKVIEDLLRQVEVGESITYETISKAIGRDVRVYARPALQSARDSLIKEDFVFDTEIGTGLVRLDSAGIVDSIELDRKKLHRRAKKTLLKLSIAKYDELDDETKRRHVAMSAQMGALAMFSNKSASKKIESRVNAETKVLPIGETLKLFS
jgi:hypothetical protein